MANIISIETATKVCSIALHSDGELIALREDDNQHSHSANITLFVDEVVKEAGITFSNIDAIAVSKGPGSYTGLRIGVSAAKGFCYGLGIPLISVNTLMAMAQHTALSTHKNTNALLCPMIDARRMEVFCALINHQNQWVKETDAVIVDENSFRQELEIQQIVFFGDGASKCQSTINNPNAIFVDEVKPSAKYVGELAWGKFNLKQFEDVAYFEPFYLKEFVATTPKKQ